MTVGLAGCSGPVNFWGNDGSAGAASGTPQLPTALSGYTARPPWRVAAVDYPVGVPSTVTLQDPVPSGVLASALSALGGSYSSGSNSITFSGSNASNATISGWDFSLHNGLNVVVQNCTNPTLSSNKFGVGSNLNQPLLINTNVNGCIIEFNEFDGAGLKNYQAGFGLIEANGYGTTLIQYNYLHDAYSEHMVLGNSPSGPSIYQVQYNLFSNAGLGQPQGAHGDWVQIVSSNVYSNFCSGYFRFNTCIQNNTTTGVGAQGFSFNGNDHYFFGSCVMDFNTVMSTVVVSGGGVNTFFNCDYSWLVGVGSVCNNYCDPTGMSDSLSNWVTIVSGSGGHPNTYSGSGNINMTTGAAMPTESNIS